MKPTIQPMFNLADQSMVHEKAPFFMRPKMLIKRISESQAAFAFPRGPGQVVEIRVVEISPGWSKPAWSEQTKIMKAIRDGVALPRQVGSLWVNDIEAARVMMLKFWRYGRFLPRSQREEPEQLSEEELDRRWERKQARREAHRKREQLREAYETLRKAGYTVNPDGTVTAPA